MARTDKERAANGPVRRNRAIRGIKHLFTFASGVMAATLFNRAAPDCFKSIKAATHEEVSSITPFESSARPQAERWSNVPAHERSEVNFPALGMVLVVLIAGAFVIHAVLWWWANATGTAGIDNATSRQEMVPRASGPSQDFPRLQLSPQRDLQEFLVWEQERLHGSAPLSSTNNLAHVPIEDAMRIIADKGPPRWKAQDADKLSPLELQQRRARETKGPR